MVVAVVQRRIVIYNREEMSIMEIKKISGAEGKELVPFRKGTPSIVWKYLGFRLC